jgi:tetratricopeptide (TPR) repeat protein
MSQLNEGLAIALRELKNPYQATNYLASASHYRKEAQKKNEWMYMQLWKIDKAGFSIDNLIAIQNKNILDIDTNSKFTYNSLVKRTDGINTKIRIAEINAYPALEVTGFIHFEGYILSIVLFTPKELLNKNLRKLQYLLKVAESCKLTFDNLAVIKQLLDEIRQTVDKQEQSDKYFQIGIWFLEMDDIENAFINFKKSIDCFPTHYKNLKGIIQKTLSFGLIKEAKQYSTQLFEIEPTNPTGPQDLIDIYFKNEMPDLLIELFNELIDKNKNIEVLGNLNFHMGLVYINIDNKTEGASCMAIARQHFEIVFPKDHIIFKSIKEFELTKQSE